MDIGTAEYITNNVYCNLTLVGESFDKSVFGIVIPKNWLYTRDLDVNVLSLRELGELDNLKQKWFQKSSCPEPSQTSTAMKVEPMGGLFLIFGVISILSLLLFIWSKRNVLNSNFFALVNEKYFSRKTKNSARRY